MILAGPIEAAFCQATHDVTVRGFVADETNGERIGGARISIDGSFVMHATPNGYFEFIASQGNHTLEIDALGYESARKPILIEDDDEKRNFFFQLRQKPIELDSVNVTATRRAEPSNNLLRLQIRDIQSVPKFAEPDPLRVVQSLPGVTAATSDFNAQIYLRGGAFDETLIAIDNVPVYNPYHLAGWLSMFNGDIISGERLYRSNYPVNFGGYLSGVLALDTREPNRDRYKGIASLGITSMRGYVEGPAGPGSVLFSARRSYLDIITGGSDGGFPFYFYDLYGKYSISVGTHDHFMASAFYSQDSFDAFAERKPIDVNVAQIPSLSNQVVSFQWRHSLNDSLSLMVRLYSSKSSINANGSYFGSTKYASSFGKLNIANSILDMGAIAEMNFTIGTHKIVAGFEAKQIEVDYAWDIDWDSYNDFEMIVLPKAVWFFDYADDKFAYAAKSSNISLYVYDNISIWDDVALTLSYRASYLQRIKNVTHSPTISLSYKPFEGLQVYASAGKYYQYLYSFKDSKPKRESGDFSPFSVSFLAENASQLAKSNHYSAGLKMEGLPGGMYLEAEGYYKTRRNISSSYPDPKKRYVFENGYAVGLDILLRKDEERFNGWIGYSLSRSVKRNNTFEYFSNSDRTHTIKVNCGYNLFEGLKVDLFWTLATGVPYTDVIGKYVGYIDNNGGEPFPNGWQPIDGRKNGTRAKGYQRLDIGVTGRIIWGEFLIMPYAQVFNVLNAPNEYTFRWNTSEQRASSIAPTIGVTVEF